MDNSDRCSQWKRGKIILKCENVIKGSTINDLGGGAKLKMDLFFSGGMSFFPGEGPPIFFLDFLRAPPQIINGRPLIN